MFPYSSEEKIKYYKKNGYILFKNIIDEKLRLDILEEVYDIFKIPNTARGDFKLITIYLRKLFNENFNFYHGAAKAANYSIALNRLSVSEEIINCIRKLGIANPNIAGRSVIWFQHKSLAKTENYHALPAHQEWSNMQGSIDGIVAWTPLNNISKDMGRLKLIPHSHKLGLSPISKEASSFYDLTIESDYLKEKKFKELLIEPGDLLLFSALTIHKSGINNSDTLKMTVNFRYNNISEKTFIDRNYYNPFKFSAPDSIDLENIPKEILPNNK